jgi:hypothetical protein
MSLRAAPLLPFGGEAIPTSFSNSHYGFSPSADFADYAEKALKICSICAICG